MAREHVYIVGAGFCAMRDFLYKRISPMPSLSPVTMKTTPFFRGASNHLTKFVSATFDHSKSAGATFWPNLEDVFTNIDMAANTGHHLGPEYAPSKLRTTRRVLLARMMCMLQERLSKAEAKKGPEWTKVMNLFKRLDLENSAFISMNWDTVIEQRVSQVRGLDNIDYGCGAIAGTFPKKSTVIAKRRFPPSRRRCRS